MRRRQVLILLASTAPALMRAFGAGAADQRPTGPFRIAFLESTSVQSFRDAFEQGLRENGLVPGQTIVIDYRTAGGSAKRFDVLASEVVSTNIDLIVAPSTTAALAAKRATATIPIVIVLAGDPVGSGLVGSLAHPDGNVTGTTSQGVDFATKHLGLLSEAVPDARSIAVLTVPGNPPNDRGLEQIQTAAAARGLVIVPSGWLAADELDAAFARITADKAQALVVFDAPQTFENRERIIRLTAEHRLPAIYQQKLYVQGGGLMSYGPDVMDLARRSAWYVARLLRGVRPADLPVEQPTKFELIINLKTAKALGLTISQSLLLRADDVIQ
jgi:putative tryptophan/tyrosine transport system substrate-binding protein